jgi:hypothetical protein
MSVISTPFSLLARGIEHFWCLPLTDNLHPVMSNSQYGRALSQTDAILDPLGSLINVRNPKNKILERKKVATVADI